MHQLSANEQAAAVWDEGLIARYDLDGPRYTSYPTAPRFHRGFGTTGLRRAIEVSNERGNPLSVYFHIPLCSRVCYYCACNRIITANRSVAGPYLARLEQEMALIPKLVDRSRPVHQLHWGGGTPTFINDDEKRRLMTAIRRHFNLLVLEPRGIRVTPAGRVLIRRICMVFDIWPRAAGKAQTFSKII